MADQFGWWFRQHRTDSGYTQRTLAEALGVGFPHVSKIETGRERASLRVLNESAALFGVDRQLMLHMAGRCTYCGSVPERDLKLRLAKEAEEGGGV